MGTGKLTILVKPILGWIHGRVFLPSRENPGSTGSEENIWNLFKSRFGIKNYANLASWKSNELSSYTRWIPKWASFLYKHIRSLRSCAFLYFRQLNLNYLNPQIYSSLCVCITPEPATVTLASMLPSLEARETSFLRFLAIFASYLPSIYVFRK